MRNGPDSIKSGPFVKRCRLGPRRGWAEPANARPGGGWGRFDLASLRIYFRMPVFGLFRRSCRSFFLFRFGFTIIKFPLPTRVASYRFWGVFTSVAKL